MNLATFFLIIIIGIPVALIAESIYDSFARNLGDGQGEP